MVWTLISQVGTPAAEEKMKERRRRRRDEGEEVGWGGGYNGGVIEVDSGVDGTKGVIKSRAGESMDETEDFF